jgi:hypothetical protein
MDNEELTEGDIVYEAVPYDAEELWGMEIVPAMRRIIGKGHDGIWWAVD